MPNERYVVTISLNKETNDKLHELRSISTRKNLRISLTDIFIVGLDMKLKEIK